jgi:hypothetical protein
MKGPLCLILAAVLLTPAAPVAAQTLCKNKDIVGLVESGISADVIISVIEKTPCQFDVYPSVLSELKRKGVPDSVLQAMVEFPNGSVSFANSKPARKLSEDARTETVEVVIPDGTPVEVETAYTVSSGEVEEGSAISFRVVRPIKINDRVVVRPGASATARVTKAKKGGSWGRAGSLAWEMQDLVAVDSTRIPARFAKATKGDSKGGTVTTGIVVTGLLFWPAAPLWGFKKGKNATVPAGKRFEVFTHGDTTVKVKVPVE